MNTKYKTQRSTDNRKDKRQMSNRLTIAQFNKVSLKERKCNLTIDKPYRIQLPEYFNIPPFKDIEFQFENKDRQEEKNIKIVNDTLLLKKLKDLGVLAEGMKRAKNTKQQSRYYFTQGVLLHNHGEYQKAIHYFQKFFKIVHYFQDEKSMELVLNAIGIDYINLKQYEKAIEFHIKQGEISKRADVFVAKINEGICNELMNKPQQAYSCYQQANNYTNNDSSRQQMIAQFIQRVQNTILTQQAFMTEHSPKILQKRQPSPNYKLEYSPSKKMSTKVKLALESASNRVGDYIESKKDSFIMSDR